MPGYWSLHKPVTIFMAKVKRAVDIFMYHVSNFKYLLTRPRCIKAKGSIIFAASTAGLAKCQNQNGR
jgi:hypothetical protein